MRSAPGAVSSFLAANNVTWRADLITLTLLSGGVYRWTTWDADLTVGGFLFRSAGANGPLVTRGPIQQSARLQVDTLDMQLVGGAFTVSGVLLTAQAAQGWFDGARLQLDHLIMPSPGDVSLGPIPSWFEGRVASVALDGPRVVLRCKSELEALNQTLPRFRVQASCGHAVYDANCGLSKGTFTLTGTVSAVTNASKFSTASAALTAKAAGYFNLGVLAFTSGALNGQKRAVQAWNGSLFTMALPFTAAPSIGDGISVYPGCDRLRSTCNTKFTNLVHYRGFPSVPGPEAAK
jgi:uncharacterized phage protein (TIGR02218 family)